MARDKRPSAMPWWSVLILIAGLIGLAIGFFRLQHREDDCTARGGVLVRTVDGYTCIVTPTTPPTSRETTT